MTLHSNDTSTSLTARSSELSATEVDAKEIPSVDEVPVLVVAAAAARGVSRFRDVGELRVKESDRFEASLALAQKLGCRAWSEGDDLFVEGLGDASRFAHFEIDAALGSSHGHGECGRRLRRFGMFNWRSADRGVELPRFLRRPRAALVSELVIAIDGPAGSGKSTVARAVAALLGWSFLDTGAMYRSVTAEALSRGIDVHDAAVAMADLAEHVTLTTLPRPSTVERPRRPRRTTQRRRQRRGLGGRGQSRRARGHGDPSAGVRRGPAPPAPSSRGSRHPHDRGLSLRVGEDLPDRVARRTCSSSRR